MGSCGTPVQTFAPVAVPLVDPLFQVLPAKLLAYTENIIPDVLAMSAVPRSRIPKLTPNFSLDADCGMLSMRNAQSTRSMSGL
jgi:hypothetical protein